jgi:aromatic ring-opening dioxygenase LigB subunit
MTNSLETPYGFFFTTINSHETLSERLDLFLNGEMNIQHLDLIVSKENETLIHQAALAWAQQIKYPLTIQILICPHASKMEIMAENTQEGILTAYAYHEEDGYSPLSYACAEQLEKVISKLNKGIQIPINHTQLTNES